MGIEENKEGEANMNCIRIYSDKNGESHFDEIEIELTETNFAPPAPPMHLSEFHPATQYAFCVFPSGWVGDWHPTPAKQLFFVLSGELAGQVSDGEMRHLKSGKAALIEDTKGKGHKSWVVNDEDVVTVVVQVPDNGQ